ncbi:hypothetical protein KAU37_05365, partial [Candidatus Bipolaricaulota bacterium]|nr:hypothetical protein [Candidatus Bipolaricaulota bacterium]
LNSSAPSAVKCLKLGAKLEDERQKKFTRQALARLYREWDVAAAICPQCRALAGFANTLH